jgi:hypothetical protein
MHGYYSLAGALCSHVGRLGAYDVCLIGIKVGELRCELDAATGKRRNFGLRSRRVSESWPVHATCHRHTICCPSSRRNSDVFFLTSRRRSVIRFDHSNLVGASEMPVDDIKKRKACQSCTRSKAKCSPSENRSDLCYRCQRLGKSCVFEESLRRRVPKSRSYVFLRSRRLILPLRTQGKLTFNRRVKQLEQRVDTLIDLLAAGGQNLGVAQQTSGVSHFPTSTMDESSPQPTNDAPENEQQPAPYITPAETPESFGVDKEPFYPYDPVEAGVLTRDTASALLKEFGDSYVPSFPFVVVPPTTDADALRLNSPFLFLAIMTVTAYRTPAILRYLNKELKEQIATRLVRRSHKSLEILQGLLIYGSWSVLSAYVRRVL